MRIAVNHFGFGYLSIIAAIAIVSTMAIAGGSFFLSQQRAVKKLNSHISAAIIRSNIKTILENPVAWQNTINDPQNINLSCFRMGASCYEIADEGAQIVNIRDVSNEVYYSSSMPSQGLNHEGENCSDFVEPNGLDANSQCPFRYEIRLEFRCADASCFDPPYAYDVIGVLVANEDPKMSFNPTRYDFLISR